MKTRILAALVALVCWPALAAVETTTVNGTVYDPSATGATGGKIVCTLSASGAASNGSTMQKVAGKYQATIQSDGTVSFTLVPNDVISPSGTYYTCEFTVSTTPRATWTELWRVDTSPDPVAIGSIVRLDGSAGITVAVAAGSNGQLQYNSSGAFAGAPGMVITGSGLIATTKFRYQDSDTNGDGTIDLRIIGDYSGDGTLNWRSDAVAGILNLMDPDGDGTWINHRYDTDGDGTADSMGMTFRLGPGKWGYGQNIANRLWITRNGITIEGSGRDSTIITALGNGTANGNCGGSLAADFDGDGTTDTIDNGSNALDGPGGDTTGSGRCMFLLHGSNLTFRDFAVDQGNDSYLWTQLAPTDSNYCNPNDTDGDGSGNGYFADSPLDECPCDAGKITAPCTYNCSTATKNSGNEKAACVYDANGDGTANDPGRICPVDEPLVFCGPLPGNPVPDVHHWTFENLDFKRYDMVFEDMDANYDILVSGCRFFGGGEESGDLPSGTRFVNNYLERCSSQAGECIETGPRATGDPHYNWRGFQLTGNTFKDCVGPCFQTYGASTANSGSTAWDDRIADASYLNITGNVMKDSGLVTRTLPLINISGVQHASGLPNSYNVISGNVLDCGTFVGQGNCLDLTSNLTQVSHKFTAITGNTIRVVKGNSGISVKECDSCAISSNTITLDGDGTSDNAGINVLYSTNTSVTGNATYTGGNDSRGIILNNSTLSDVTGNSVKCFATASRAYGIGVTSASNNSVIGNTVSNCDWDIRLDSATSNTIRGNYLNPTFSAGKGVDIVSGSNNIIEGNLVNCGGTGDGDEAFSGHTNNYWNNQYLDCTASPPQNSYILASPSVRTEIDQDSDNTMDTTVRQVYGNRVQACMDGSTADSIYNCFATTDPTSTTKTQTFPNCSGNVVSSCFPGARLDSGNDTTNSEVIASAAGQVDFPTSAGNTGTQIWNTDGVASYLRVGGGGIHVPWYLWTQGHIEIKPDQLDASGEYTDKYIALQASTVHTPCSAASGTGTVTIDGCDTVTISGASAITTLNTCASAVNGRVLMALCGSSTTAGFTDGSNLKLNGNFTCTADDSITLLCDGTNWIEIARSAN